MSSNDSESLVLVYSTPVEFDAELVKAMLSDEGIPSMVENANGPFPGISASPVEVYVAAVHEAQARESIEQHEARHRERLAQEENQTPEEEIEVEEAE